MLNPLPVTQTFATDKDVRRANLTFHFGAELQGAVVRVCVIRGERILSLGSGVIATSAGRVLTAAHVLDLHKPGDLIAIGTYQSDEGSTRWEYYAIVLTPDQDLLEEDRNGRRVDYAVLAIRGRLELRPAEFCGYKTINYETISIEPTPLTFDNFVGPAPPEAVQNLLGVEVLLCGYPSPLTTWTSISVSRGSICMVDDTGMLSVHAFIHGGSSGGPAFIRHEGTMYVAGIVSHNPAYQGEVINNLACIRSVHASCLRMLPQHYASVHA